MTTKVHFDRPKMKRLQARYDRAVEKKEEWFVFDGEQYLTDYAKYLLEYLRDNLGGRDQ